MDESVVAMAMILGVPIGDMLYLAAKGRGGYDDAGGRAELKCTYIWPSFVSEGMRAFLDSEEWKRKSYWDNAFYAAVNRSLDLTIDKLGRLEFAKNLALYKEMKQTSHDMCLHNTTFPCSIGGQYTPPSKTDCMWKDSGCGFDCLDSVASELL